MEHWAIKPLRPLFNLPSNPEIVVIEKKDPTLVLKGSLAEKLPAEPTTPNVDPPVYNEDRIADIVKSYLRF